MWHSRAWLSLHHAPQKESWCVSCLIGSHMRMHKCVHASAASWHVAHLSCGHTRLALLETYSPKEPWYVCLQGFPQSPTNSIIQPLGSPNWQPGSCPCSSASGNVMTVAHVLHPELGVFAAGFFFLITALSTGAQGWQKVCLCAHSLLSPLASLGAPTT